MAIHTKLQLDPTAEISLRTAGQGTKDDEVQVIEIVVVDPDGEASAVIELSAAQYNAIRTGDILDLR
jgi:hypothetical protein